MAEVRRLVAQGLEQLELHPGVGGVVIAANDVGDPKVGVIDDGRERVEEGSVGADHHGIGERADVDGLIATNEIIPRDDGGQRIEPALGVVEPEAPVRLTPLRLEPRPLGSVELETRPIVDGRAPGRELTLALALQLVLGLVAGIKASLLFEEKCRRLITVQSRRLALLACPRQPQPLEILADPLSEGVGGTRKIGVVEAQPEGAALPAREQPIEDGGAHVANVKAPCGARREADGDGHACSGSGHLAAGDRRHPIEAAHENSRATARTRSWRPRQ